jgi:hypothetical protein
MTIGKALLFWIGLISGAVALGIGVACLFFDKDWWKYAYCTLLFANFTDSLCTRFLPRRKA